MCVTETKWCETQDGETPAGWLISPDTKKKKKKKENQLKQSHIRLSMVSLSLFLLLVLVHHNICIRTCVVFIQHTHTHFLCVFFFKRERGGTMASNVSSPVSFPFTYTWFLSFFSRLKGKMFGEKKGCKCCCSTLLMYTYKMDMIAARAKEK